MARLPWERGTEKKKNENRNIVNKRKIAINASKNTLKTPTRQQHIKNNNSNNKKSINNPPFSNPYLKSCEVARSVAVPIDGTGIGPGAKERRDRGVGAGKRCNMERSVTERIGKVDIGTVRNKFCDAVRVITHRSGMQALAASLCVRHRWDKKKHTFFFFFFSFD
jgi:hypothetical protein